MPSMPLPRDGAAGADVISRRGLLATGLSPLAVGAWDSRAEAAAGNLPSHLAKARERVVGEMARAGVPGAAAALLVDAKPVWIETFGSTDTAGGGPIDDRTIFSIQSTSKTFAATAVMMAVQRGLLDLDAPLTRYLPQFTVNSRLEDVPVSKMTLRRLLSHHAGLTHEAPVGNNYIAESPSFEAHVQSIQSTWLRYRVGERYSYSNLGIDIAGYVLERAAGIPYAEVLRRWLFEPLGMRDTTLAPEVYEANRNRAIGHMPGYDRVPLRLPLVASGGVYTSIGDMVRYARFHLGTGRFEGRDILSRSHWEEMHTFRYGGDYALGIGRFERQFGGRAVPLLNHNGGGFGFACTFTYSPAERVAWIVLSNGQTKMTDGPDFFSIMPEPLLESRYGRKDELAAPDVASVTLPPATLQAREGLYMNQDSRCDVIVADGALTLNFRGEGAPNRLAFLNAAEGWVLAGPRKNLRVRFRPARDGEAPAFEMPGGNLWDFIDGPALPPRPVADEYDDRLGDYQIVTFGKPTVRLPLAKRNGYLYLADIRLTPDRPGLLFSGQGEVVDLRGPVLTARSIRLTRVTGADASVRRPRLPADRFA